MKIPGTNFISYTSGQRYITSVNKFSKCIAVLILVFTFLILLTSYDAESTEPLLQPYGVIFGQKFDANQHRTIVRRGNVRSVELKTAHRPDDTEKLLAEICDDYGLQVITWRNHIRSSPSALSSHNEILKKIRLKFGAPRIKQQTAFWISNDINIVVKIRRENNTFQNQIRYFGPNNKPCFEKLMLVLQGNGPIPNVGIKN